MRIAVVLVVLALGALSVISACAPVATPTPSPTPSPTPTPAEEMDVRERVIAALQRPGMVTKVRVVHREMGAQGNAQEYAGVAWIDVGHRRARSEEEPRPRDRGSVTLLAEGIQGTYDPEGDFYFEHPFGSLPPEMAQKLPPSFNNPALFLVGPIMAAIWMSDGLRPSGAGEWEGKPATVWEADYPGPEGDMHTYSTLYLDPETSLPMGEEVGFAQHKGDPIEGSILVSYEVEFVAPESLSDRFFDIAALRELHANFGGKLEDAKGLGFRVLWLGRTIQLGAEYQALPLHSVYLREPGDRIEPPVSFFYRDYSRPALTGDVHVMVWSRQQWEESVNPRTRDNMAWWRALGVKREAAVVDGVSAEYAIGHPDPSKVPAPPGLASTPPPPTPTPLPGPFSTEMLIWLPDSVVKVGASRILGPPPTPALPSSPTPTPAHDVSGPTPTPTAVLVATPDWSSTGDINPFNREEAMRHILDALVTLE